MARTNESNGPNGYMAIHKPSGITSFDVIRELRRQLKIKKMGHSGVLDKPATGVLVVGLNKATKLFELFGDYEKEYDADIYFGLSTTTDDLTGELTGVSAETVPSEEEAIKVANTYVGTLDQIPPAFSLTKIGGKELYRYALEGKDVEVKPKRVTVLNIEVIGYETGIDPKSVIGEDQKLFPEIDKLPELCCLKMSVRCVGGVYIRSLARDIGADLGTLGTLGKLVRTRVGPFKLEDSLSLDDIAIRMGMGDSPASLLSSLSIIAPEESRIKLDATQLSMVRNGRSIQRFKHHLPPAAAKRGDVVYGIDPGGELVVILNVGDVNQHGLVELKPVKVIS